MKHYIVIITCILLGSKTLGQGPDQHQIEKAIMNYVEAFYEADTAKAYESVIKDLAERGYYTREGTVRETKMSFEQLIQLSQRWKSSQIITPQSPKKITVFEVLDRIAAAKVEAERGIDYFHLAKEDGK